MNHELTQQEFEQNVTAGVQYALAAIAPTEAMPRSVDAARFVDALRAEGYVIEPLPVPATPVEAAPAPRSHAKAEAPMIPAVPGQVTW